MLKQLHEQCMGIMQQVKLGYLVEREGGWGTAKQWSTTLSLGEQQRMGMGRLFFHRCARAAQVVPPISQPFHVSVHIPGC